MCRAQGSGHPTVDDEGDGMCRYFGKPETRATTPRAHELAAREVTDCKEASNVAFPGTEWPGKPKGIKKGLMRYLEERVFVDEEYIPLGVQKATVTEERIKHVQTPQGPRSAINVVDVVEKPLLAITVRVLDDFLPPAVWGRLWEAAQEIGVGADRSRGDGKFDLVAWEKISG